MKVSSCLTFSALLPIALGWLAIAIASKLSTYSSQRIVTDTVNVYQEYAPSLHSSLFSLASLSPWGSSPGLRHSSSFRWHRRQTYSKVNFEGGVKNNEAC